MGWKFKDYLKTAALTIGGAVAGGPWGAAAGFTAGAGLAEEGRKNQQANDRAKATLENNYNSWQDISKQNDPRKLDTYDAQYFNQLKDYANSNTDSKWLEMSKQRLADEQLQRTGDIQAQIQSGQQSAFEQLAMRGGVRRGDSVRLAESGALAGLLARQRLAAETSNKRNDLSLAEQQNKLNLLAKLPEFERARAEGSLKFLLEKYRTDAAAWAANQQGQALLGSGGGGGFFG